MSTSDKTKWDVLTERRQEAFKKFQELDNQINGLEATPCGLRCSGCNTLLETEADFAQHFIVAPFDIANNNLNLGNCPVTLKAERQAEIDKWN